MLKFNSLLLFSENPQKLSEFYKKVFQQEADWGDSGYSGFMLGAGMLIIGPHDKIHGENKTPERLIVNFETPTVEKEFARIKKLGAKVVKEPYHPGEDKTMMLATFADPDGNYFQLATPMK